jgi:hypothetical protein
MIRTGGTTRHMFHSDLMTCAVTNWHNVLRCDPVSYRTAIGGRFQIRDVANSYSSNLNVAGSFFNCNERLDWVE